VDDWGVHIASLAAVFGDKVMRPQEQIKMAVNIADGVASHHACPGSRAESAGVSRAGASGS
jgi:hypothetical protein